MMLGVINNAGIVPFIYKVQDYLDKNGGKWTAITDVQVHDVASMWVINLAAYVDAGNIVPVEIIESSWTSFQGKPLWWLKHVEAAFATCFGKY